MAALEPQYMTILKKLLAAHFVTFLPTLLGKANPIDQAAKQLSRAVALYKLLEITPQAVAVLVVAVRTNVSSIIYRNVHNTYKSQNAN